MTTGKLNKILEALDGISYLDWVKLEREVNQRFNADIRLMSNTTPLRDTSTKKGHFTMKCPNVL